MAITLTGTGGLMTRLGKMIYTLTNTVGVYQATSLPARAAALQAQYTTTDENLIASLYPNLASAQNAAVGFAQNMRTLAQNTVSQMVAEGLPLSGASYQTALAALVAYLNSTSNSVQRNTVSASAATTGGNIGNGFVLVSNLSNLGLPLEYMFAEAINAKVVRDSFTGSAIPGQESIQFLGQTAQNNSLSWLYPQGSGAQATLQAVNAGANAGRGTANMLVNGSFETDVTLANVPDKWHIGTGTAGTTIFLSTGQFYDGAASLNYLGNGSENTSVYTQFGTDFPQAAVPLSQYCVGLWVKADVVPAAGVASIELVDGSGTILQDAAGNNSAFTVAGTGLSTSWVPYFGFLRTPRVLPSVVRLRIRLSTAWTSTRNVYFDRCSLAVASSFYTGGPAFSIASGNVNFVTGDSFTVTTTSAGSGLMTLGCDRLLGLRNSGLIFPSTAGSPTISDALVV